MTNSLTFDNIPMMKIFNSYSMSSLMQEANGLHVVATHQLCI